MIKRSISLFLFLICLIISPGFYSQESGIKTVVIDAGHGGKDPGCSGKNSKEKTIALAIALKLGKLIKDNHEDVNVIYTRDSDVFLELDERASIANKNKADLFICIHANANDKSTAHGVETYVLGLHRTDEQQEIANRENSVVNLEGDKSKYKNITPDMLIARTMQLSVYLNQSILFAGNIQKEFKKIGRYDRGVKQAGFVVLYKTTMPSVLIESGFLTNADDENFLSKDANQDKMALSIYNAFKEYKIERDKIAGIIQANKLEEKESGEVVFKIQLASSGSKIDTKPQNFKGLEGVEVKDDGKYYRYYYGHSGDYNEVKKSLEKAQEKGYKDAFILAFLNSERISLKKAINLAQE